MRLFHSVTKSNIFVGDRYFVQYSFREPFRHLAPVQLKLKQMIYRNSYTTPEIAVIDVTIENDFCGSPVNNSLTFAPDMMFGTLEEEN